MKENKTEIKIKELFINEFKKGIFHVSTDEECVWSGEIKLKNRRLHYDIQVDDNVLRFRKCDICGEKSTHKMHKCYYYCSPECARAGTKRRREQRKKEQEENKGGALK